MKKYGNKLILTASILSYVLAGFTILLGLALGFDFFGLCDLLERTLVELGYEASSVDTEVFIYTMEFIIGGVVEIYFANFYLRLYRTPILPKEIGNTIIIMAVLQILFASFVPAIFAIIAGVGVKKGKGLEAFAIKNEKLEIGKKAGISEFKMTVMTEAVSRLNELRQSGAISEEEYYASLNRILES